MAMEICLPSRATRGEALVALEALLGRPGDDPQPEAEWAFEALACGDYDRVMTARETALARQRAGRAIEGGDLGVL